MTDLKRRTLLTATGLALPSFAGSVATAAGAPEPAAHAIGASDAGAAPRRRVGGVELQWLGNAGWSIATTSGVTLVDPYVTRFDTGLARGAFDATTPLRTDADAIARHCPSAERILVTHTHWDHVADVPTIARRTGAMVFGTRTTGLVARAMGVPTQSVVDVRGGEVLDFGDLVVEVVSSRHSRNARHAILFPGTLDELPSPPRTIADLPEGDTLAFVVGTQGGRRVYVSGASDVDTRSLADIAPDVACVPVPSTDATHEYLPRLLDALDRPRTVVAVHWDDLDAPLGVGDRPLDANLRERLSRFTAQVRRISPRSDVVIPRHLQRIAL